jgi:ferredoxin
MALMITEECIVCNACEPECPNNAIYEPGVSWRYADGTGLIGQIEFGDGDSVAADAAQKPISDEFYYIVPDKCTECTGFHEEPQCAVVCPVDCCVPDPDYPESKDELLEKKNWMHV